MQNSDNTKQRFGRLIYYCVTILIFWTLVISVSLVWNILDSKKTTLELAAKEARTHIQKDTAFRLWATSHGGVYVPTDERTPPNPKLAHIEERDITTPSGKKLTLMNPAYMLRQVLEEYSAMYQMPGRITSLKLFNPNNAPDDWEKSALESFERDDMTEISEITHLDGVPHLRMMQPMITEEGCLKCHSIQGYKVGDIRGGISVSVPLKAYFAHQNREILQFILSHGLLWILGFAGIFLGHRGMKQHLIEQNRAEDAVRESEEKFRSLFDDALDMIHVVDTEGRIVDANKIEFQKLGYTRDELIGMKLLDIIHPEVKKDFKKTISQILKGEVIQNYDTALITKKGEKIYAEVNAFPKKINGKIVNTRSIIRDLTKFKLTEKENQKLFLQLQQKQKMEAIGTLAGGIAHDFNNILTVIMGYTELALVKVEKDALLHSHLQKVFQAGHRAKDLVGQILTFSRQDKQEFKPVQLNLLVDEVLKLIRASLPSSIKIVQSIESESTVLADSTQMHQVLMNLFTNAGQAMKEGGLLEVKLEDVVLDEDFIKRYPDLKPGLHMHLIVQDSGSGMSPEVLDRIFEPFFTTKGKDSGTGLGLSVVHGIVNNHKGLIKVYSESGKGAIFHVYLPVLDAGVEIEPRKNISVPKGTERILLVDDEKNLIDFGKDMLESLGYKVTSRTSSLEALELFKARADDFDLVITDMTMPNMNGDELAGEILAIRPEIPVILCTGYSSKLNEKEALALGIQAYVLKPIIRHVMAHSIRKVLAKK